MNSQLAKGPLQIHLVGEPVTGRIL